MHPVLPIAAITVERLSEGSKSSMGELGRGKGRRLSCLCVSSLACEHNSTRRVILGYHIWHELPTILPPMRFYQVFNVTNPKLSSRKSKNHLKLGVGSLGRWIHCPVNS